MNKPAGKLLSLEAGRALAALAVVAFHAEVFGANLFTQTRHFWFDWGSHGVDFFFVLSGFIIFHAHRHDAPGFESAYAYIVKRLRRIYVPYLPVGMGLIALYLLFPSVSVNNRDWGWVTSLTLIPTGKSPALAVAWTLTYEMVFYAFFLVFFATRWFYLFCLGWGAVLAVLLLSGRHSGEADALPLLVTSPLVLEFLAGMAAAWSLERVAPRYAPALVLAGLLGIAAFALADGADRAWLGLALAPLVLGMAVLDSHGKIQPPRFLVFLGKASYAIYLVHTPIISVAARVFGHTHVWGVVLLGSIFAGVAGGVIFHQFYERPTLDWLRRRKQRVALPG